MTKKPRIFKGKYGFWCVRREDNDGGVLFTPHYSWQDAVDDVLRNDEHHLEVCS